MTPAPLDVRVARVLATPVPFLAYFLIRVPQVTTEGYVPWVEAVPISLLTMVAFSLWVYWVSDLFAWRRDRPTLTSDELDATEGVFAGELPDVMQGLPKGADGKFAAVPVHRATNYVAQSQLYAREWAEQQHEKLIAAGAVTADGETYLFGYDPAQRDDATDALVYALSAFGTGTHAAVERFALATDDRPTEPLLLTHEFTPASGLRLARPDLLPPESYVPERPGRHRAKPRTHLPPLNEVENADAYTQLNRTREMPF